LTFKVPASPEAPSITMKYVFVPLDVNWSWLVGVLPSATVLQAISVRLLQFGPVQTETTELKSVPLVLMTKLRLAAATGGVTRQNASAPPAPQLGFWNVSV